MTCWVSKQGSGDQDDYLLLPSLLDLRQEAKQLESQKWNPFFNSHVAFLSMSYATYDLSQILHLGRRRLLGDRLTEHRRRTSSLLDFFLLVLLQEIQVHQVPGTVLNCLVQ
jgi:hypothetical protein